MAILSMVMEQSFGNNKEGEVIHCDSDLAKALAKAGIAREATAEDMGEKDEDGEEGEVMEEEDTADETEKAEGEDDGEDESEDDDNTEKRSVSKRDIVKKAAKLAVDALNKNISRPNFGRNLHVAGSDETLTGGFKSMGDAVKAYISKGQGCWESQKKFRNWSNTVSRKGFMSIGGSSGHAGGDLVPQQWADDLFRLAFKDVPNLLEMCANVPMENQTINLPAIVQASGTSGIAPSVPGEGIAIPATQAVTANVQLTLVGEKILVNVTDELMRFNSYALDSVIRETAPERIQFAVNDGIVNGTNGQINLVNNAVALTQIAEAPGRISYNDIVGMNAKLWGNYSAGSVWLTNQSSTPEIYNMPFQARSSTYQTPVFVPGAFGTDSLLGPKPLGMLLGKPIYQVENVPGLTQRGALILWHPKSCFAGTAGPIADYTNALYFNLAQDTFRFILYYGTANRLTSVYTRADGSKASNIVLLSAGSTSSS